ncbi:MAG: hypothetical protein U5K99_04535 [Anaerolineales bacterium]|nr:hypothetical protein [Anaerolineales bacterium]
MSKKDDKNPDKFIPAVGGLYLNTINQCPDPEDSSYGAEKDKSEENNQLRQADTHQSHLLLAVSMLNWLLAPGSRSQPRALL